MASRRAAAYNSPAVTTRRSRHAAARAAARPLSAPARGRHPSIAPEHLGERASVAVLAVVVLGFATFVAGVAMLVGGLTIGGSFGEATPPPNVGELGFGPIVGGIGLITLGTALAGSGLAAFAAVRGSRVVTAGLSALAALLALAGAGVLLSQANRDLVLAAALGVTALVFGASAALLARRSA